MATPRATPGTSASRQGAAAAAAGSWPGAQAPAPAPAPAAAAGGAPLKADMALISRRPGQGPRADRVYQQRGREARPLGSPAKGAGLLTAAARGLGGQPRTPKQPHAQARRSCRPRQTLPSREGDALRAEMQGTKGVRRPGKGEAATETPKRDKEEGRRQGGGGAGGGASSSSSPSSTRRRGVRNAQLQARTSRAQRRCGTRTQRRWARGGGRCTARGCGGVGGVGAAATAVALVSLSPVRRPRQASLAATNHAGGGPTAVRAWRAGGAQTHGSAPVPRHGGGMAAVLDPVHGCVCVGRVSLLHQPGLRL